MAARAVLDAPADKLPAYVGVAHPDGGYGLYRISAVEAAPADDSQVSQALRTELVNLQLQQELQAYLASLRKRYEVEVNARTFEAARS